MDSGTYLSTRDGAVGRLCALRKRATSFDQFERNLDTRGLIVHNLWVALESALDICRYIVGRSGTSTTGVGAQDLIEKAREAGVLEPPLAAKRQDVVALKDAILHEFWRLDYQHVYNALWRGLGVLDEFARQIKRRLEVKRR